MSADKRLLVVSNRLPITCKKGADGSWTFSRSSGGLVAALSGLHTTQFLWIGWPGIYIEDELEQQLIEQRLLAEHGCIPVWMSEQIIEGYYNGFSNGVLWPLFHYQEKIHYREDFYADYQKANQQFADCVARVWTAGDLLWVHDYHLMLLPRMLRTKIEPTSREDLNIGFFLHIPFPSSEVYRVLPSRGEILRSLLECDLIGFHTFDYARHFMQACNRVLGVETAASTVFLGERAVPVGVFPVGIEPKKFLDRLQDPAIRGRISNLRNAYKGKRVLIGVDRLDYIKGIPQKLRALQHFFRTYPEWIGKLVLIQVAVPSREDVEEYQKLKSEVDELVGRINSKYGRLGYHPIQYMYHSVDFDELCVLYSIADAALITSLRDGMNLVALEYVACQNEGNGALILSEFAGAAQSLSASVRINPWRTKDVSLAIHKALHMPLGTRKQRQQTLFNYVMTFTAASWGQSFLRALLHQTTIKPAQRVLVEGPSTHIDTPKTSILMLSYHGTLVPLDTIPRLGRPSAQVTALLEKLASAFMQVIVVCGQSRETVAKWFQPIPQIGLAAEHGHFYKPPDSAHWKALEDASSRSWKAKALPIMRLYTNNTPGSILEEKEATLTWYHRAAGPYGIGQANEMREQLRCLEQSEQLDIVQTARTVEVVPRGLTAMRMLRTLVLPGVPVAPSLVLRMGEPLVALHGEEEHTTTTIKCLVGERTEEDVDMLVPDSQHAIAYLAKLVA